MDAAHIAVGMVILLWFAVLLTLVVWAVVRSYRARWRQRLLTVPHPVFRPDDVGQPMVTPQGRFTVAEFVSPTTVVIVPETR